MCLGAGFIGVSLEPKQIVSSGKLLRSQAISQEALTRLPVEMVIFTKEEFLEMVRGVNHEMNKENERN